MEPTRKIAVTVGCVFVPLYLGYKLTSHFVFKRRLQKAIRQRQRKRAEIVEQTRQRLELADNDVIEKRQRIVSLTLAELIDELQNDALGPVEVLESFQWSAIKAHDLTNCICLLISEANTEAQELERKYRGSSNKPPLYGVPFSVKESIKVKGYDQTAGYAHCIGHFADEDALVVRLLRQNGAIPFVLTNVPQSLLSFNCSNPIYGCTLNPANQNRTSGGSSGGEAALIACSGSVLGIGGDVGGSIRMPCHWCGVAGLKPCRARLSQCGSRGSVPGRPMLNASVGPMAHESHALAIFMKTVLCPDMYSCDAYVVPIQFRDDIYNSTDPLTIGYYDFDGYMPATPACRRAVEIARDVLQRAGHTLVRFQPPNVERVFPLFLSAATVDGGQYLLKQMKNDIVDSNYAFKLRIYALPVWLKRLMYRLMKKISPDFSDVFRALSLNTSELRAVYEAIENYRELYTKRWRELELDAVISPPNACMAMTHGTPEKVAGVVSYSALFNLLDFPAGVVPVCRVTGEDENKMKMYDGTVRYYAKLVKNDCCSDTVGLPVGVQCAALPFNEEICLRVMRDIETGMKNSL